jgi:hypothetical protein
MRKQSDGIQVARPPPPLLVGPRAGLNLSGHRAAVV